MTSPSATHGKSTPRKVIVPGSGYHTASGIPSGVALLTDPKKMPGHSWSLPAKHSCPGHAIDRTLTRDIVIDAIVMGANGEAIDACNGCYANPEDANGGNYRWATVKNAQRTRYAWTLECLKTPAGREAWIAYMADQISALGEPEFRWHDAGDVFSAAYGLMIRDVVRRTPDVQHWLPTHSWWIPAILPALRAIHAEPNAAVHPSALKKNAPAPVVPGLGAGTTVITNGQIPDGHHACPANTRHPKGHPDHGKCLGCRVCWGKDIPNAFPFHS